jgi:hypothetical protein
MIEIANAEFYGYSTEFDKRSSFAIETKMRKGLPPAKAKPLFNEILYSFIKN